MKGLEVRNEIINFLTINYNNLLGVINGEKGITAPDIKMITSEDVKGQLPAIFVDLKSNEFDTERLNSDVNFIRVRGTVEITIILKNAKKQEDYMEIYIETLIRCLSYRTLNVSGFVDIYPVSCDRLNLYDKNTNSFYRTAIVVFEYQLN